ncbi:hypothetical protein FRB96_001728 [Tulasnella sp. 330]|nr:hypothetical protein FRB96_001728 [Tulasnella sp. 330]KAG8882358.1 hypothetical protein FRB97_008372 [Tulasnella sp. 331]KAG8886825.1 hypothetical protein FRB98_000961 [Tulasnella sp. 332]
MFARVSKRWELESTNLLATNMLDTTIPSFIKDIRQATMCMTELNTLLHSFLPLSRREELLEYERDLRIRQTTAWSHIHDWVLTGLQSFIAQSLRLIDIIDSRQTLQSSSAAVMESVYDEALTLSDRCQAGRNQTLPIALIYGEFGGVIQYYSKHPIPKEEASILGSIARIVAKPPHTSAGDFERLISLTDQIRSTTDRINTALNDLNQYFAKLTAQFDRDEMDEAWAAQLDVQSLHERWSRLQVELVQKKQDVIDSQNLVSKLPVSLYL